MELSPCDMREAEEQNEDIAGETAHRIGHDPWWQVGFLIFTGFNSAYVLGYSKIILTDLGWVFGTLSLLVILAFAIYSYQLLASLHYAGGKRNIRYRDLAGHVYGPKMYIATWLIQHIHLFLLAIGYLILAGQSLKGFYWNLTRQTSIKLPHWISIAGILMFLLAFSIPHLSAMRVWMGISTVMTFIYITIVLVFVFRDGQQGKPRNYDLPGSTVGKVFNAVAAVTNIVFSYGCTILPEIQATLRSPAVRNMKLALYVGYGTGVALMYLVTMAGYWAYGSQVSSYILNDVNGSKAALAVANLAVFVQTLICNQAYSFPIYEFLDTKFGIVGKSPWSLHNSTVRLVGRGFYCIAATFLAAFLPFIGDFSSLTGATSTIPLTFVFPNHMYLKLRGKDLSSLRLIWHYFNVVLFTFMILIATISSIRSIALDFDTYHVFANI